MSLRPPWDSVAGPLGTQARMRTAGASGEEWFIFVVLFFVRPPLLSLSQNSTNKTKHIKTKLQHSHRRISIITTEYLTIASDILEES